MAEQKWNLDNTKAFISGNDFEGVAVADIVAMDTVLRDPNLVNDDTLVTARMYLSEAAEKRIEELAEGNWDDTNDDDLDSFVDLLDRFSSRDASGYKGKAAEVMKKIELRRELLKNQREEIEAKRLKRLETLTPAELWELRKQLKEQNSPEAQEENKKLEDFILVKTDKFINEPGFGLNDEQAPALKELLEDIEKNPLTAQTDQQKEMIVQVLGKVNEQIADFEERHRLAEEARNDEIFEKSLRFLEGMPSDEVLFKRGEDGKLPYSEFEEVDNILSHLQVKGELTLLGRKSVDQTSQDSDIALFRERIRLETQVALASRNPEEITEEAFRQEYAARLNQGIFEVVYANSIVAGKTSKKDMLKLVSELSKSAQKGTPVSVHQDVLIGWHAGHQNEYNVLVKRLKSSLKMQKSAELLATKLTAFSDKCKKKYKKTYSELSGLLETAGWGAAYGIAANPAVMAATGGASVAVVATLSLARSSWRFYKNYKKARDEAAGQGKKLGFWKYAWNNKMQTAGVLLSATAAITGGLDVAGAFAKTPEVFAGITQARMGSGLALWGASTVKQVGDAYRHGGWKAAMKITTKSFMSFVIGFGAGRAGSVGAVSLAEHWQSEPVTDVDGYTGASIPTQTQPVGEQSIDVADTSKNLNAGDVDIKGGENVKEETVSVKSQSVINDKGASVRSSASDVHAQSSVSGVSTQSPDSDINVQLSVSGVSSQSPDSNVTPETSDELVARGASSGNPGGVADKSIEEIQDSGLLTVKADIQKGVERVIEDMQKAGLTQDIKIQEEIKPLFTPEGINEDGSIYGTRGNGDSVSAVIDENGKFERLTIKGHDLSEEQLNWINKHPGVSEGLEDRAMATNKVAQEMFAQNSETSSAGAGENSDVVANMGKYLEGEWKEYNVQEGDVQNIPGTPMSVDGDSATVKPEGQNGDGVNVEQSTPSSDLMERMVNRYHDDLQNNHGLVGKTHDVSNYSSSETLGGWQTVSLKIASVADNGLAQVSSDGVESFTISEDGQFHFRIGEGENVRDMTYDEAKSFVNDMKRIPGSEGSQTDVLLHKGLYELNPKQFAADYSESFSELLRNYTPPEGYNAAQDLKLEGHTETSVGKGKVETASSSYDAKGHIAALRERMPQTSSQENASASRNVSTSSMNMFPNGGRNFA